MEGITLLAEYFQPEVRSRKDMCTPWALAHFVADARSSGVLLSPRCGDWQTSRQWLFHQRDPSVSTLNREPCRLRMELQQRNEKAFAFLSCQDCGAVCYCGTAWPGRHAGLRPSREGLHPYCYLKLCDLGKSPNVLCVLCPRV